jgi:hypothetical protein
MKARLDNEYFPIINAVPKHAGRSSRIWDIGLCGDSAASGTLPHEDGKSGLSSHVFDQGWIFGYFPHAPSLGISESLSHTCGVTGESQHRSASADADKYRVKTGLSELGTGGRNMYLVVVKFGVAESSHVQFRSFGSHPRP